MSIDRVRRVVMGEVGPDSSAFTHVEEIEPVAIGARRNWHIWGWDAEPQLPLEAPGAYVPSSTFPPRGGVRVFATRGPLRDAPQSPADEAAEAEIMRLHRAEPAGMTTKPGEPGMHRTDTIDIGVIVSGEVTIEAEDGSTVTLGPGDVYVQNGALHRWHPNPDNPAHIVFVLVGAERRED
jgi:uncharacterized cupin superfamily protein